MYIYIYIFFSFFFGMMFSKGTSINSLAPQSQILTLIAELIGINTVKRGCFFRTHVEQIPLSLREEQTLQLSRR